MSNIEKHYLDELSDELSLALGRAVWAFARIENLLFEYTNQLSTESDLNGLLGYQRINKRIEIIKKLIEKIRGLNSEKTCALACLDKVCHLSDGRNQFAHNPWQIWVDFEDMIFKTEIHDPRKKRQPIDKDALAKFTKEAEELVSQLKNTFIPLVKAVRGF